MVQPHFHSFFGSTVINTFIGEFSTGTDLKIEVFVQTGFMESYIADDQSLLKDSSI